MASLSQLIRSVQQDLPITVKHEQWLAQNSNPTYSPEALDLARKVLSGEVMNRKRMLFRSSSTGFCERRRIIAALGIEEPPLEDSKLVNIFHNGNFLHLKWQMAGLTAGWLAEAEVVADDPSINFGGTLDGILCDGSGFEFKTINDRGHMGTWMDPKPLHVKQVHAYMVLRPDIEKFSIVYENKYTSEWREMRVQKDPKILRQVNNELGSLLEYWEERKLPPVLTDCRAKKGTEYRQCPFSGPCLESKTIKGFK